MILDLQLIKGEFTSRYLNVRGSFGGTAGSVGGDAGLKGLVGLNKGVVTGGISGELALLVGLKDDLELDINYSTIKNDIKELFGDD